LFAQHGASVICADVDDATGREVCELVTAEGGVARFVHTDVRSSSDLAAAVAVAESEFGKLDVVVANAGTVGGNAVARRMEDLTDDQWDLIVDINLTGVFRTFRAAIPALRRAGGGSMSATASIAGLTGVAGQAAYSATKGGIIAMVKSLAYQLAADHIRVNCVCPGGVNTNLLMSTDLATMIEGAPPPEPVVVAPGADPIELMRRAGSPEEVAAGHLFLVSDESSFVNGHALVADAGSMIANMWLVLDR